MFLPNHLISLTFDMHFFYLPTYLPTTNQPPSYLLVIKHLKKTFIEEKYFNMISFEFVLHLNLNFI
jgi:hypothetical protein